MLRQLFFRRLFSVGKRQTNRFCTSTAPPIVWNSVKKGPEDPILGITQAFQKDESPVKINLGVGAYRDDMGKPFILQSVRNVEKILSGMELDHEYAPIAGFPAFNKHASKLIFGSDSIPLQENRIATVQTLSGTGALRIAGSFLQRFYPNASIYFPRPTWANHTPIFQDSGLSISSYTYFHAPTCSLDFDGMISDLSKAPAGSVVLLHACAHNPTGVDPTKEQWEKLSTFFKEKKLVALFDCAYQGFATGDPDRDAFPVRYFAKQGHLIAVCQSFAKNFGLYGERIGALNFIGATPADAQAIESQLKILIRPMYSNPPIQGARIISTILSDKELTELWRKEVKLMADRIGEMRRKLVDGLKEAGSKKDWSHITQQIGMFCYSGLSEKQVERLATEYHVYMTLNGRISIAGISSKNVSYLAKAIHAVSQ